MGGRAGRFPRGGGEPRPRFFFFKRIAKFFVKKLGEGENGGKMGEIPFEFTEFPGIVNHARGEARLGWSGRCSAS